MDHPEHDVKTFIREAAGRHGFQKVGFAEPAPLEQEVQDQETCLAEERHGTMTWMTRRLEERRDPRRYFPPAKTIVSLAMNYYTSPDESGSSNRSSPGAFSPVLNPAIGGANGGVTTAQPGGRLRWSSYAWGDDYHRLLKKRLKALLAEIAATFPRVNGIACVDTSPVMEKVWAKRAGLGWQGKHTVLITRDYGSWLFLGELLLNVALEPDSPFEEDLCGSCTACLEACPTGALTDPYRIDASRCISYLTIEHRRDFSREEAGQLHGWVYGCDVCQEVCPWNIRFARPSPEPAFAPREFITTYGWEDWAELSRERWEELFEGSAASRVGYERLKQNVFAQRFSRIKADR